MFDIGLQKYTIKIFSSLYGFELETCLINPVTDCNKHTMFTIVKKILLKDCDIQNYKVVIKHHT